MDIIMKHFVVLPLLLMSSSLALAQHVELIEVAHGISSSHMLYLFLENNSIDGNTPKEKVKELIDYYNEHEEELLVEFDVNRHISLIEGISQAKLATKEQALSVLAQIVDGAQEAAYAAQQQRMNEKAAAQQRQVENAMPQQRQQIAAGSNYSTFDYLPSYSNSSSSGSSASLRDLYTSDQTWNSTVDKLAQQYGPERARQMIQQMKQANNQTPQSGQSSHQATSGTRNPDGTIVTAITTNRTMVYINVQGGSVTHYATGKNTLGEFNWNYVGRAPISSINMTQYNEQFGREYSRAANINGIGYVFFN